MLPDHWDSELRKDEIFLMHKELVVMDIRSFIGQAQEELLLEQARTLDGDSQFVAFLSLPYLNHRASNQYIKNPKIGEQGKRIIFKARTNSLYTEAKRAKFHLPTQDCRCGQTLLDA